MKLFNDNLKYKIVMIKVGKKLRKHLNVRNKKERKNKESENRLKIIIRRYNIGLEKDL